MSMISNNYTYTVRVTLDNNNSDVYTYVVMPTNCTEDIPDSVFEEERGFVVPSAESIVPIVFFGISGAVVISCLI